MGSSTLRSAAQLRGLAPMEGYTNDRTAASDALRNGYVNAILPPTPAAGAAVAAVPVVGVGASATAETSTVSFAMHERQELYSYMAGTLGQADDAPSGYMALSRCARRVSLRGAH